MRGDAVIEKVRKFCVGLPEVKETGSVDAPSFLAGRRPFVLVDREADRPHLRLRLLPALARKALVDEKIFKPQYGANQGWIALDLDATWNWTELRELLVQGYRGVAGKRMLQSFDAASGTGKGRSPEPASRPRRSECQLCVGHGGRLIWKNSLARVVLVVDEEDYPGFCRVVVNRHVREFSDLLAEERHDLMDIVAAVEEVVREVMEPQKVNLASLGNVVPHVHWHVVPRFEDDRHFPAPIWSNAVRASTDSRSWAEVTERLSVRLIEALASI